MLGERQSVTAEDLEKMVYLEQVVLACLCLHPVQLYTIVPTFISNVHRYKDNAQMELF